MVEHLHPGDGIIVFARADGGFSVWDVARNIGRHPIKDGPDDRPTAFHFTRQQVWDGLEVNGDGKKRVLCNGLIDDWLLWQGRLSEEFTQLKAVLGALSPSPDEPLEPGEPTRVSLDDVRDFPTLQTPYQQDVPIIHASSGIRRIVALAYLLVWAWREHVAASRLLRQPPSKQIVLLIDEVEAHLHPRWQRVILPALLRVVDVLTGTDEVPVQLVAASHSPLLLASLEPHFDPARDGLWKLELRDQQVHLEKEPWALRGDASAWLTSDIFDLPTARSVESERAIQRASQAMQDDAPTDELREITAELGRLLKGTDPFWVRWNHLLHRRGALS